MLKLTLSILSISLFVGCVLQPPENKHANENDGFTWTRVAKITTADKIHFDKSYRIPTNVNRVAVLSAARQHSSREVYDEVTRMKVEGLEKIRAYSVAHERGQLICGVRFSKQDNKVLELGRCDYLFRGGATQPGVDSWSPYNYEVDESQAGVAPKKVVAYVNTFDYPDSVDLEDVLERIRFPNSEVAKNFRQALLQKRFRVLSFPVTNMTGAGRDVVPAQQVIVGYQ